MGELKAYTCDGGCGATTMLDHSSDSVTHNGWNITYTPAGQPTIYTCSLICLGRVAVRLEGGLALPKAEDPRGH